MLAISFQNIKSSATIFANVYGDRAAYVADSNAWQSMAEKDALSTHYWILVYKYIISVLHITVK